MAARIALQRANVRTADGSEVLYANVSVRGTNDNVVLVNNGPTTLVTYQDATVTRYTANSWKLVAGDGATVLVEIVKTGGCGCGR